MLVLVIVAVTILIILLFYFGSKKRSMVSHYLKPESPLSAAASMVAQDTPIRDMHPVLAYQYLHDNAINPANLGDPIRIPDIAGPSGPMYGNPSTIHPFSDGLFTTRKNERPYSERYPGPFPGRPMGVPVPAGALKISSEAFNGPYGSVPLGDSFPYNLKPYPNDYFRPYGPNAPLVSTIQSSGSNPQDYFGTGRMPAVGSSNAFAPFPEVNTAWEKAGVLTSLDSGREAVKSGANILNLYRRPIAPAQDLWEYSVQDKNNFIMKLEDVKYLDNGDIVNHVDGKEGMGPWKVKMYINNKWIWV